MQRIVVFASGNGSNAEKIILHFKNSEKSNVVAVFSNNAQAKVLNMAKSYGVATFVFTKEELNDGLVLGQLNTIQPELIVLAGFLWKFPESIIKDYPNKVINVHPALLPKYGGKGMYGRFVHEAVLKNKELETGITIHYVNEHYDEGEFIFQKGVSIEDCATADEVAARVHALEHEYFPQVIEQLLNSKE